MRLVWGVIGAVIIWQTIVTTLIWLTVRDDPQSHRYQIAIADGVLSEEDGTRRSGVVAYRVDTLTGAVSYCEVAGGQGAGKRPWPECLLAVELKKDYPRDPLGLFQ